MNIKFTKIFREIAQKNRNFIIYKLFTFLIISTIIFHLFTLIISELSNGLLWTYGNRYLQQKDLFSLGLDGSYFEHFQYIILLWCSLLSLLITIRQSKYTVNISTIYIFLFIDDLLSFHDRIYNIFISFFEDKSLLLLDFLRVKDIAEITFWLLIFLLSLLISLRCYSLGDPKVKQFIKTNFLLFFILSIFGKIFDIIAANIGSWLIMLNIPSKLLEILQISSYLIEEIGEITILSCICIWLFIVCSEKSLISKKRILSQ